MRSVLSVVWINRSCKPANLAFTMSIGLADAWVTQSEALCLFPLMHLAAGHQDGGADRDRTDDLMLAKHALSQLSYGPLRFARNNLARIKWWARDELNVRPHAYQACALTT